MSLRDIVDRAEDAAKQRGGIQATLVDEESESEVPICVYPRPGEPLGVPR